MDETNLQQFAYISKQTDEFSEDDLNELMRLARKRNRELKLTGLLLFDKPMFFQVLEGPLDSINTMRETLLSDKRHQNMDIIFTNDNLYEREFGRWSMGCKILGDGLPADYKDLDDRVKNILKISKPNAEAAHQLLLEFRDMQRSFIDI